MFTKKIGGIFDLDQDIQKLVNLKKKIEEPLLWNDHQEMSKLQSAISQLEKYLEPWFFLEKSLQELLEYVRFAEEENDETALLGLEKEYLQYSTQLEELEICILLNEETDHCDAYLNIHPGAGGVESQDWAEMLLRMYQRWAQKKGFETELISFETGEGAGIKDATLLIKGTYAFGYLSAENGIHRLVRLSPFNAQNKRQTSFCGISVSPALDHTIEIIIDDKDLRIDTFRASGAGGQHVNKVSSAVRITHIPTGLSASCQSERSQLQNRDSTMNMLRSKLYKLEKEKQEQELAEKSLDRKSVEWGNQIRSYVFQPSTIVKDHRTNTEKNNAQMVMDGDIDDFMIAWLKMFKTKK
ncbi:MAG: peptide chain release factor 2 [Brevinema sp.]